MTEIIFRNAIPPRPFGMPQSWLQAVKDIGDRVPPGLPRFIVAGGAASLINWLVRFPISECLPFWLAVAAAYSVGMVIGFGLYRSWVFPGSPLQLRVQIARFVLVNLAGMLTVMVGADLLAALFRGAGLPSPAGAEALAHGIAITCGAGVNFIGHRAVTFARRRIAQPIGPGLRPGAVGGSSNGEAAMRDAPEPPSPP